MTAPVAWRLKDKIIEEFYAKIYDGINPVAIKMSKTTLANLGIEMNMIGDITMIFGMPVLNDESVPEGTYVITV